MSSPHKPCGTCRDRKIRCDRASPSCSRCMQAGRLCKGYGVQLFWPRGNDKRRAIVAPLAERHPGTKSQVAFVNVFSQDVSAHERLSEQLWERQQRCSIFPHHDPSLVVRQPIRWIPYDLNASEKQLLQYFESVASFALRCYGQESTIIRHTLIRMALSEGTSEAVGVLKSLLALASVHRYGLQGQAIEHKMAALRAMKDSTALIAGGKSLMQHIAAGMALCSFEVQTATVTCGHWISYVQGAKTMINLTNPSTLSDMEGEFGTLLHWVYYHDVMARFSLRHWKTHTLKSQDMSMSVLANPMANAYVEVVSASTSPSGYSLHLLSEVCNSILNPSDPRYRDEGYRDSIHKLKRELLDALPDGTSIAPAPSTEGNLQDDPWTTQLFILAGLIYLERASSNVSGGSDELNAWVDMAFQILRRVEACPWPFPLLIFGSEANSDLERKTILGFLNEAGLETCLGDSSCLENMLRTAWAQDDLGILRLSYLERMGMVFNIIPTLPAFI